MAKIEPKLMCGIVYKLWSYTTLLTVFQGRYQVSGLGAQIEPTCPQVLFEKVIDKITINLDFKNKLLQHDNIQY